ncbi:MAG: type 1 glutamine amidotransferase domain-containing protein [Bacteroidota bacterium]
MKLEGKKVAILTTDGFEQVELTSPKKALEEAGAITEIVAPNSGSVKGWDEDNWGDTFEVDRTIVEANASDYNALLLPGGVMNPDSLRTNQDALSFVRDFFRQQKPVAAICHGGQTLINAELVEGRKLTSYPAIRKDMENAGARWLDEEVVVDQGLVTSRSPEDLKAFNDKLVEEVHEGKHEEQAQSIQKKQALAS